MSHIYLCIKCFLISGVLLSFYGCSETTNETLSEYEENRLERIKEKGENIAEDVKTVSSNLTQFTIGEREEAERLIGEKVEQLDRRISELKANVIDEVNNGAYQTEAIKNELLSEAEDKREALGSTLKELEDSGEQNWRNALKEVDTAMSALEDSVGSAEKEINNFLVSDSDS